MQIPKMKVNANMLYNLNTIQKYIAQLVRFSTILIHIFYVKKAAKEGDVTILADSQRRSSSHSLERGQGRRKFLHHWIAGNLPLNSECEVCEEACGDGPGIVDLRCCWCQR